MTEPNAIDLRVPILLARAPIKGMDAPCNKFFVPLTNIKSAYVRLELYLNKYLIIGSIVIGNAQNLPRASHIRS